MIFPRSLKVQGCWGLAEPQSAQTSPVLTQAAKKTPTAPGYPSQPPNPRLSEELFFFCSKSAEIVVHKTQRNASWITIMEFSVFFWSLLPTSTPGLSLTPSPYDSHSSPSVHVCLSVSALYACCISLQISNTNHSSPSIPSQLLRPPPSILVRLGVSQHWRAPGISRFTQWVWSLLAEPPGCSRSMTKPVRATHCYSRLDCIWRTMRHAVNELKKWSASIDQISWKPSICSFFMEVYVGGKSDCWEM